MSEVFRPWAGSRRCRTSENNPSRECLETQDGIDFVGHKPLQWGEKTPRSALGVIEIRSSQPIQLVSRQSLMRTPVNKGDIEKDRNFWRLRPFRLRASKRSEG